MPGKSDASGRGSGPAVDRLVADAEEILGPVQLVDDLTFSNKATVVRLRVAGGATMIAKQPRRREMFVRELEALRLLPATVRPALLASGPDLFVVEDLGPGPSLADLLLGDEPNAAGGALMGWAETLGHAQAATLREGQAAAPEEIPAGLEGLKRLSAELDVEVGAGVEDDAALIAATLARRGSMARVLPERYVSRQQPSLRRRVGPARRLRGRRLEARGPGGRLLPGTVLHVLVRRPPA